MSADLTVPPPPAPPPDPAALERELLEHAATWEQRQAEAQ